MRQEIESEELIVQDDAKGGGGDKSKFDQDRSLNDDDFRGEEDI